jgi:hypothetical protein
VAPESEHGNEGALEVLVDVVANVRVLEVADDLLIEGVVLVFLAGRDDVVIGVVGRALDGDRVLPRVEAASSA